MLGTQVRGINHLHNLAKAAPKGLILFNVFGISQAVEYIVFPYSENRVIGMTRNNPYFRDNCYDYSTANIPEEHREGFEAAYNSLRSNPIIMDSLYQTSNRFGGSRLGNYNYAAPLTFDEDYAAFCKSNHKVLSSVFGKYISENHSEAKLLYLICDGNANFFTWAVKMIRRHGVSIASIAHIMQFNLEYSQLTKNLKKGNIVALGNSSEVTEAVNEIFNLRAQAIAKQTLNWFNPAQKKLLRDRLDNHETVHTLNNFNRLSRTKRINFIRKVSTIEDADEIIKMMSFLCTNTHFAWNKDSFMEFISNVENLKCEVVFDKNNVVVIRVDDYETIKRLGKTTNWCISKNRQYWEQYMGNNRERMDFGFVQDIEMDGMPGEMVQMAEEAHQEEIEEKDNSDYDKRFNELLNSSSGTTSCSPRQFMMFDFNQPEDSRYSIVGFTASCARGVTHAHNFVNDNMMGGGNFHLVHNHERRIDIFLWAANDNNEEQGEEREKNKKQNQIHSHFEKHGINVGELCKYNYPRCNWDKESVKRFISEYCHPDKYYILFENEDKLIIKSTTDNMSALMTNINGYFRAVEYRESENNFKRVGAIWHLDFTKNVADQSKIIFWKIFEDKHDRIEKCYESCDEIGNYNFLFGSLTEMLDNYGIPFDIIKRPSTIDYKINVYATHSYYDKVFDLMSGIEEPFELSNRTCNRILNMFVNESKKHNLDFWSKFNESKVNFAQLLKPCAIQIAKELFNLLISNSTASSLLREKNVFNEIASIKEFIEFNNKCKAEWDTFVEHHENLNGRNNKAHLINGSLNVSGYSLLLNMFITKIKNNGLENIYNSLIPKFIECIYDSGYEIDNSHPNITLKNMASHHIISNMDKWVTNDYNDVTSVFKMLYFKDFGNIALSKLEEILKNNLTASQISKIITTFDRICGGNYGDSRRQKALKMICTAAMEQHAISEETAKRIIESKLAVKVEKG